MSSQTQIKMCTECGAEVPVQIPDSLQGPWREMALRTGVLCRRCADEREAARAEAEQRLVAMEQHKLLADRVRHAGVPKLLRGVSWDRVDENGRRAAVAAAKAWGEGGQLGVMLTGDVGVGKTTIAAAAAWEYLRRGPLRWCSVPSLMVRLSAGFRDESRKATVAMLEGRQALVLDDLDKVRPSEYAAEQLFLAIESRVTEGVPLLVTTNLSLDDIADRYPGEHGPAITSRLAGYCEICEVVGPDRRISGLQAAA